MLCRRIQVARPGYMLTVSRRRNYYSFMSRSTCIPLYPATDGRQTGDMLTATSRYKWIQHVSWWERSTSLLLGLLTITTDRPTYSLGMICHRLYVHRRQHWDSSRINWRQNYILFGLWDMIRRTRDCLGCKSGTWLTYLLLLVHWKIIFAIKQLFSVPLQRF